MVESKMAYKMASTWIFVFAVSLQPFNRFSSNFYQKSRNIFPNLLESARISIWQKTNGVQNGVHLNICFYCISSTVQPIFIKFSPKISKYISQLIGIR